LFKRKLLFSDQNNPVNQNQFRCSKITAKPKHKKRLFAKPGAIAASEEAGQYSFTLQKGSIIQDVLSEDGHATAGTTYDNMNYVAALPP